MLSTFPESDISTILTLIQILHLMEQHQHLHPTLQRRIIPINLEERVLQFIETMAQQQRQHRNKRKYIEYRREEALNNVERDYFHVKRPIFADREFQRVFWVTKTIFQRILETCANANDYFTQTSDAIGCNGIDPREEISNSETTNGAMDITTFEQHCNVKYITTQHDG
jgi:hypothetical protein